MKVNLGSLRVTSPAFTHGARIPDKFTVQGTGVSPELAWSGAHSGTKRFAVAVHDPDAPLTRGFVHWVVYNIPGDTMGLPEGCGCQFTVGANGLGKQRWEPPGPIRGHGTHYYYFHVYALGVEVDLAPELSYNELLDRIDDHIICQARLVGTYSRD